MAVQNIVSRIRGMLHERGMTSHLERDGDTWTITAESKAFGDRFEGIPIRITNKSLIADQWWMDLPVTGGDS